MKEKKKPTTFKTIQDNQDENIKEEDLKIESTEE